MGVLVLLYYGQGRLKHNGWHAGDSWQGDWRGRVAMELKGVKKVYENKLVTPYYERWGGADHLLHAAWASRRSILLDSKFLPFSSSGSFICLLNMEPVGSLGASVSSFTSIHQQYIYTTSFLLLSLSLSALALPHGSLRCNVFSFHCSFILHLHLSTSTPNSINSTNNTASMRMAMSSCQWCLHIQS